MQLQRQLNQMLANSTERRMNNNTRARCRRKAKKLCVEIEIDNPGYWLVGTGWEDENFCMTWDEVEGKLDQISDERNDH